VQPTPEAPPKESEEEVQDVTTVGDLSGATILAVDIKLMKVFGDYIHQNDGTHLDGGIEEDDAWQGQCSQLIALLSQHYDAPSGALGQNFICLLTKELEGICCRKWISEWFLVFQMVMLQHSREVKTSSAIRRRLTMRMDSWEASKFAKTCT
jgi:hypothetical protein